MEKVFTIMLFHAESQEAKMTRIEKGHHCAEVAEVNNYLEKGWSVKSIKFGETQSIVLAYAIIVISGPSEGVDAGI